MDARKKLIVYWSRRDFRLCDNWALTHAIYDAKNEGVLFLPVFVLEDYMVHARPEYQFGYPSRFFLSHAIPEFAKQFPNFLVCEGKAAQSLITISGKYDATIYVNEDVWTDFYKQIKKLERHNVSVKIFKDSLTVDRHKKTGQGNTYSVFTPFKNAVWSEFMNAEAKPKVDPTKVTYLAEDEINKLPLKRIPALRQELWNIFSKERLIQFGDEVLNLDQLTDKPDLDIWYATETQARETFEAYVSSELLASYKDNRDSLEKDTESTDAGKVALHGKTSKMSLALAWGLISARILKNMIKERYGSDLVDQTVVGNNPSVISFLSELIWREFYKYLYFHNQNLMSVEFQKKFQGTIAWVEPAIAKKRFTAWIQGKTGYPIVDAAMNQLAKTGWMHNRSRMIVASILTKNLGVDWRWGQEYFRATLIDLDETSNNGGWQWGASVGADPKPIRIFNAELQAKNYDASGAYQKKWLPGGESVDPIVEHKTGRDEALKRYGLTHHKPRDY